MRRYFQLNHDIGIPSRCKLGTLIVSDGLEAARERSGATGMKFTPV